ncbi:hypothetical protein HK100_011192 [Physocladia obscura]|uniref:TLC domain-containing protein n=1 Tax=Physocladia obscura TaxID=109957 RepID=A0AAD5T3G1_9FUNG|nr:hypothetical protein HK100_011192 [Physocladia obscura]
MVLGRGSGSGLGNNDENLGLVLATRIFVFTAAYCILHVVLDFCVGTKATRRFRLSFSDRISVSEKVASSLNALYVSSAAIYNVFIADLFVANISKYANLTGNVTTACPTLPMAALLAVYPSISDYPVASPLRFFAADYVMPAYVGYSIYDCITMYFQGDNHWSMWVHHLVGIYGGIGNLYIRRLSVLSTFAMITEVTAFFVNILWYAETLNENRPQLTPIRRASITATLGDTDDSSDNAITPSNSTDSLTEPLVKDNIPTTKTDSSKVALNKQRMLKKKKRTARPTPTPFLLALQTLRTLSFLIFRVPAVPYSFYCVITRGTRISAVSLIPAVRAVVDLIVVTWYAGSPSCDAATVSWTLDRILGITALVVQIMFGFLNFVWTFVAVKVLLRELRAYFGVLSKRDLLKKKE